MDNRRTNLAWDNHRAYHYGLPAVAGCYYCSEDYREEGRRMQEHILEAADRSAERIRVAREHIEKKSEAEKEFSAYERLLVVCICVAVFIFVGLGVILW